MKLVPYLRSLCTPAQVYLVIGALGVIVSIVQNADSDGTFCAGSMECEVEHTGLLIVLHIAYVALWTFILGSICKAGHKGVAWFLVLVPFILGAIAVALFMMEQPGYRRHDDAGAYVPQ